MGHERTLARELAMSASLLTEPGSIVGGVRYWMDSPDTGPHGFGGRLGMTFLFSTR